MGAPKVVDLKIAIRTWWSQSVARLGWRLALRTFATEMWGFLRESTPEQRRRRYGDVEYDWDHGVDTSGATVDWRDRLLGVFHSPYQPTEPALFHEMLQALAIDFTDFVFVDLGSGKGRTLLMAAEYPFRRIIGVELLPALHRVAQENLRKHASPAQTCFTLEAVRGDACEFEFPSEPTVLYLFNPLPEAGLARVAENLERSLTAHPRKVFVLYHNPLLECVLAKCGAIRKTQATHQYAVYESA
jgi:SAM-dependent methyltransferase